MHRTDMHTAVFVEFHTNVKRLATTQWDAASSLKFSGARIEIGERSSERFGQVDLRFTSGWDGRHPRKYPWLSLRQAWDRSNE